MLAVISVFDFLLLLSYIAVNTFYYSMKSACKKADRYHHRHQNYHQNNNIFEIVANFWFQRSSERSQSTIDQFRSAQVEGTTFEYYWLAMFHQKRLSVCVLFRYFVVPCGICLHGNFVWLIFPEKVSQGRIALPSQLINS